MMELLTFSALSPWLPWSAILPFWPRFTRRTHRPSHTLQTLDITSHTMSSDDQGFTDLDAAHPGQPRRSLRPRLPSGPRVPGLALDDQNLDTMTSYYVHIMDTECTHLVPGLGQGKAPGPQLRPVQHLEGAP